MKVGVGADHGGFEMKQQLAQLLATAGYQVVDFGNKVFDADDDYPVLRSHLPVPWHVATLSVAF